MRLGYTSWTRCLAGRITINDLDWDKCESRLVTSYDLCYMLSSRIICFITPGDDSCKYATALCLSEVHRGFKEAESRVIHARIAMLVVMV